MAAPLIFLSAGEASGEAYGALLLTELQRRLPQARFLGMGGERMAALGCERIVRSEDVAVMGITEVLRHLPRIYRSYRRLRQSIRDRKPAVAILIDFPDIHLKLAREFHAQGIPVIFFVSPQLWAWKKHRIKLVQRYVSRMLVIFPFEQEFYREHGVAADYVGHPLVDLPLPSITRRDFAAQHQISPDDTWIGLLPGSRFHEISLNLPEMLAAARQIHRSHPQTRFLLPLAPTLTGNYRSSVGALVTLQASGLPITLVDDARTALFHARASIVASGTATVEAALIGNPFIVVYRVSPLTYAIARRVVTVPHVAMVNLIAKKRIVPELIQGDFRADTIVQQLEPLLAEGEPRATMMQALADVRETLRSGPFDSAIARVASITLETLGTLDTHGSLGTLGYSDTLGPADTIDASTPSGETNAFSAEAMHAEAQGPKA